MRTIFLIFSIAFFTTSSFAKSQKTFNPEKFTTKKMAKVFSNLHTTNNLKVYIEKIKPLISYSTYSNLKNRVQKIKKPIYQSSKMGKLKAKIWDKNASAVVEFNPKNLQVLINGSVFEVDHGKSFEDNLTAIATLVQTKRGAFTNPFINEAHAFPPLLIGIILAGSAVGYAGDEVVFEARSAGGHVNCNFGNNEEAMKAYLRVRQSIDRSFFDYALDDSFHSLQNCLIEAGQLPYHLAYKPNIPDPTESGR